MSNLTAERLRELLDYDPESGILSWRAAHGRWGKFPAGPISNAIDSYGYLRVRVDGVLYRAHRLCWLHVTGDWPVNDIDHINGIKTDNRLANLRDVIECHNMQNRLRASKNNALGVLGVHMRDGKRGQVFIASFRLNGKTKHIGTFKSQDDAARAYVDFKRLHHPGFTG